MLVSRSVVINDDDWLASMLWDAAAYEEHSGQIGKAQACRSKSAEVSPAMGLRATAAYAHWHASREQYACSAGVWSTSTGVVSTSATDSHHRVHWYKQPGGYVHPCSARNKEDTTVALLQIHPSSRERHILYRSEELG